MKVNGIKVTATEQTPLLKDVVEDAPPALVESNAGLETIPEGDDPGFKCTKKDKSGFLGVLSVLLIGKTEIHLAWNVTDWHQVSLSPMLIPLSSSQHMVESHPSLTALRTHHGS